MIRLNVVTQFSYCMEAIIQAGNKRLRIASVPVTTNTKTRESHLFKNTWRHMFKSGSAIIRSYLMFKPHYVLGGLGLIILAIAMISFFRFFIFWLQGDAAGHIQSLIFGTAMWWGRSGGRTETRVRTHAHSHAAVSPLRSTLGRFPSSEPCRCRRCPLP